MKKQICTEVYSVVKKSCVDVVSCFRDYLAKALLTLSSSIVVVFPAYFLMPPLFLFRFLGLNVTATPRIC